MIAGFDADVVGRSLPYLFGDGMTFTLALTALAMGGGIVLGTLLAAMRVSAVRPVATLAAAYVDLARSLPLTLVVFWFYFLTPWLAGWLTGRGRTVPLGTFWSAVVTFTLFEAAYYCEIVRGGIRSIPRGQVWAGKALGLGYWQTMSFVVMPQALRKMTPLLLTQVVVLFQDTSLVYVISATDFLGAAAHVANRDGRLVEMYLFAASVYFLVSFIASRCVKSLQRRTETIAWAP